MVAVAKTLELDEYVGGPGLSNEDARILGALVDNIQRERGHLKTEDLLTLVVDRSRPKNSPTHHLFEWDQAKGHALYLLDRARKLVMSVNVVLVEAPETPVRAFPVVIVDGNKGPAPMQRVLDSADLMQALLEQAKADLETWRRRYERLQTVAQLRGVFRAVDRATKKGRKR